MDTINILCATDNNYAPYCGVMLTSLFESNRDSHINAYILIDKPMSEHNSKRFARLARKYNKTIEFITVDGSYFDNFPIKGMDYWSRATYYRLYAEELLPKTIDRVLYLDCDIIVNGCLKPLWETTLSNKAVAAVPDIFSYSKEFQSRLHYPTSAGYFNAGVLLINLGYWRDHQIGKKCLNYLEQHYDWIEANDQDVLNAVLWDKTIELPLENNFQIQFLKLFFYNQYNDSFQYRINDAKLDPSIIHYAAPQKPWQILYYKMPYKLQWYKHKWKSPWWYLFPQMPKKKRINYIIKRFFLWPFGVMYTKQYLS